MMTHDSPLRSRIKARDYAERVAELDASLASANDEHERRRLHALRSLLLDC
ncbi:hypothetical protein [Cupriavidus taiwanensis]|uniref:hypothetical protein n=1 Tax=Cupriavidus taiwanensis TaxID=164546 RepID=UPI000E177A0C|nr:hypothetical protein [Cupriavidus taiwanensis]SPA17242.1 hypothetical protein CBM2631_A90318 [Cupriavidus taiwanensis]